MTIGKLSGQCDFGQKGQSYCNQRGQSCVAKRVKVAWLFHEDHIILNSVANMQKVHHLLDGYAQVYCHLDNDEAGENACAELQKRYGDKVIDHSHLYTGYKDLNEYLMSHKTRK